MKSLLLVIVLLMQGTATPRIDKGVIEGVVLAKDGSPAGGVRVGALSESESNVTIFASLAQTDSAGHYWIENVPAGRYYVTAGLVATPTYYPGVKILAEARILTVSGDVTLTDITFRLAGIVAARVSGQVIGLPAGVPTGLVRIHLSPAPGNSYSYGAVGLIPGEQQVSVHADGTFEFASVPPGSYQAGIIPGGTSTGSAVVVRVEDGDVQGVTLRMNAALGRVVVDDGSKLPVQAASVVAGNPDPPAAVRLSTVGRQQRTIDVRSDGYFLHPFEVGRDYQTAITMLPFGYYVKSVSYGREDLLKSPLRIDAAPGIGDSAQVDVILTRTPPPGTSPGVKVSGRYTETRVAVPPSPLWVSLEGWIGAPDSTLPQVFRQMGAVPLRDDRTFEIPNVPPGVFTIRVLPGREQTALIKVTDQDLTGIEVSD